MCSWDVHVLSLILMQVISALVYPNSSETGKSGVTLTRVCPARTPAASMRSVKLLLPGTTALVRRVSLEMEKVASRVRMLIKKCEYFLKLQYISYESILISQHVSFLQHAPLLRTCAAA